jgi:hypothetical protein
MGMQSPDNPFAGGPQQPTVQMPIGPQPLTGYQEGYSPPSQSPYAPPPSPYYRRQELPSAPVRESNIGSWIGLIAIMAFLVIGGLVYWNKTRPENTPIGIVRAICRAADVGDTDRVKECLTKDTQIIPNSQFSIVSKMATTGESEFTGLISGEGRKYNIELVTENESSAKVVIKPTQEALDELMDKMMPGFDFGASQDIRDKALRAIRDTISAGIPMICRKEDTRWKVDGTQTDAAFAELIKQMMSRMFIEVTGRPMPRGMLESMGFPSSSTPPAQGMPMPR